MNSSAFRKLAARLKRFGLLMICASAVAITVASPTRGQASPSRPHFACGDGYTPRECRDATAVLGRALERYAGDLPANWTWVLVRTQDWKRALIQRRFDPNSPAFTYLPERATFLDGALLSDKSTRGIELRVEWHMAMEELLDLAIRHELVHAVCSERDETKAVAMSETLRAGAHLNCQREVPAAVKRADPILEARK